MTISHISALRLCTRLVHCAHAHTTAPMCHYYNALHDLLIVNMKTIAPRSRCKYMHACMNIKNTSTHTHSWMGSHTSAEYSFRSPDPAPPQSIAHAAAISTLMYTMKYIIITNIIVNCKCMFVRTEERNFVHPQHLYHLNDDSIHRGLKCRTTH